MVPSPSIHPDQVSEGGWEHFPAYPRSDASEKRTNLFGGKKGLQDNLPDAGHGSNPENPFQEAGMDEAKFPLNYDGDAVADDGEKIVESVCMRVL